MEFRVLGPLEVVSGGRRVEPGSERRRAILAVLLAAGGEVVPAARLIDAVWAPAPPPGVHKTLRSHVSRLRAELAAVDSRGGEAVVTEADGYRAELAPGELDATRFEALVARARAAQEAEPAEAVALFREAEGLWRGPAFGELAAHEIVRFEAVRLEELRASAAADRIEAQLAVGEHEEVVGELEARVAADPLAERANGQLIVALYRSGRQAEALATYRALAERLREEYGVDPSPPVQALFERVLRQDPDLAAPAPRPTRGEQEKAARRQPGAAPLPESGDGRLFGRDEDVRWVAGLVGEGRVVTLTGPGGVGKSRLAEQVAAEVAERFGDGVASVGLASVRDPRSVDAALTTALDLPQQGGRSAQETLVAAVGTRRLLLVLDNCEHVLAAVSPLVASVLRRCPNVAVLATSREPLRLPGERVWQVPPLGVPPRDADAAEVAAAPAGALFCARAAAAEPGFALTEEDAPTVAELCRRLDGMPLAIELAAGRVRALAPDDLLERLSDRFSVLTGGPPYEGGRHRTLQEVAAWSYDLLDDRERRLFCRLSVFAASFSLEAAEQVCVGDGLDAGAVAGVLAELVDKSMVTVERAGRGVRYRLLDTLRQYGAGRLADSGATDDYRRAHADYHVTLAEELGRQVRGPNEQAASARIDAVVDDLRVAHEWLVAAGDCDGALRLPTAVSDYLNVGLRDEMVTWTERALDLPEATDHPAYPAALATAAIGAAHRGEFDRARCRAEAVLAREDTDSLAALWALGALRITALLEGRIDDVLALDDRAAAVADALDEDYYRAFVSVQGVLARLYGGDDETARIQAVRLEQTAEASGNPTMRAWARYCRGEALMDTDPTEAARHLEEAFEWARSVGSHLPEGAALVSLASLYGRHGTSSRALWVFRDAISHWRRLGNDTHQLTTLRNLVEALVRVGADEAAALLHGAVTAASDSGFGAEAERLAAAWVQLTRRMGIDAAEAAAEPGRRLTLDETAEHALTVLERLLAV